MAQNKVALDVVKTRLKKIGLSPFFLKLHSNKIDKKYFLKQIQEAINISVNIGKINFNKLADDLLLERQRFYSYTQPLHRKPTD